MRSLLSFVTLFSMALPAFAAFVPDAATVPEPGVLSLVGIGAVALLAAHRGRK